MPEKRLLSVHEKRLLFSLDSTSRFFFLHLARTNLMTSPRIYLPFALMNSFLAAMFYIMHSLSVDPGLASMSGGDSLQSILMLGTVVIGIFSTGIVFHTNGFLMKQRKKDIGIYNILGLGKPHIGRMMGLEALLLASVSLLAGLVTGMVFSKLMHLLLLKILGFPLALRLDISLSSILITTALFIVIYLVMTLWNLARIHLSNPIELIRGGAVGDREPKSNWPAAILGVLCLAGGYGISLSVKEPLQALSLFFVAVVLVIFGTHFLFTAGSIVLLKLLRANRNFYYRTNHFMVVSGMLYRMRRNAAGLANLCILSVMVILPLATTISMYAGMEDMLLTRYPQEAAIHVKNAAPGIETRIKEALQTLADKEGIALSNLSAGRMLQLLVRPEGEGFVESAKFQDGANLFVSCITFKDYLQSEEAGRPSSGSSENAAVTTEAPPKGSVLLFLGNGTYGRTLFRLNGTNIPVASELDHVGANGKSDLDIMNSMTIVFRDDQDRDALMRKALDGKTPEYDASVSFDLAGNAAEKRDYLVKANLAIKPHAPDSFIDSRTQSRETFFLLYGGLLFLGLFLGLLFLVQMVLNLYYKRISEGYEDKAGYETLQKVGMRPEEIHAGIRAQTLWGFFLPLALAGLHMVFAFPLVSRLMIVFNFTNTGLFALCTLAVVLLFALTYYGFYRLTSRAYYRIVRWKA